MAKKSAKKKAPTSKQAASKKPSKGQTPSGSHGQGKKGQGKPVKPVISAGRGAKPSRGSGGVISADAARVLDVATYAALHALVVLVPLAFGQFTFDQFDMPKVVTLRFLTLVMMATWSARFLLARKAEIRRTPIDWFILAFLGWALLSTIFTVHMPTALLGKYRRYEGFISLINYGVVFFIAVQTLRSYSRLRALAKSMVITGAAVGVYGIGQYFGYDFLQWGALPFDAYRAFATYGNPDLLVGYLAALVPIGVGLFVTTEDTYESAAYGLCAAVMLTSLMMTFSRSAWPGLLVAFIYLGIVLWRQNAIARPQVVALALCFALIIGGLTVYSMRSSNPVTSVYSRLLSLLQPTEGSAGTRYEIWQSSIDATKDKPIFGFGPDTFRLIFPKYKTVRYVQMAGYRSVADNAHSYPFQLAPALGIPGMLLFYLVVFFGFGRSVGLTIKHGGHEPERIMIAAFAAGALAYGVHLLFGLSVTGTTIFLWISFAAFMLPFAKATEIEWRASSAAVRSAAFAAVAIVIATGLYLNLRFFQADVANLRSYQFQQVDKTAALSSIDEALTLNPYWDSYRAQKTMLLMDQASANGAMKDLDAAIRFIRDSIKDSPREYDNYLFLANAYSTAWRLTRDKRYLASSPESPYATTDYDVDNPDEHVPSNALDVALYALRNVEANAPSAMVQAGLAYADLGLPQRAVFWLERAVRQDSRYSEAFYYLGNAYEKTGQRQKAIDAYKQAVETRQNAAPGQPTDFPEASSALQRIEQGAK